MDGLDRVCAKIEHHTQMLDSYISQVDQAVPASTADAAGWAELDEMCQFLDVFVSMLESQSALANDWIQLLGSDEAKQSYLDQLSSTHEVIKAAKCISLQLQQLYVSMKIKQARQEAHQDEPAP